MSWGEGRGEGSKPLGGPGSAKQGRFSGVYSTTRGANCDFQRIGSPGTALAVGEFFLVTPHSLTRGLVAHLPALSLLAHSLVSMQGAGPKEANAHSASVRNQLGKKAKNPFP